MIIVMGVPGAGKTTVLSAAKQSGYRILNYGDMMLESAKSEAGVAHRDEIRKLGTETQSKVQAHVGRKLAKEGGKVILDTHCSIATPSGYLPGLPYHLLKEMKVELLVLITAPSQQIVARRKADKTRVREADLDSILEHERMNHAYLAAYSCLTGAPAMIIVNEDGKLQEAQQKLLSILK